MSTPKPTSGGSWRAASRQGEDLTAEQLALAALRLLPDEEVDQREAIELRWITAIDDSHSR